MGRFMVYMGAAPDLSRLGNGESESEWEKILRETAELEAREAAERAARKPAPTAPTAEKPRDPTAARDWWNRLVSEKVRAGMSHAEASAAVAKEHPEVRRLAVMEARLDRPRAGVRAG